MMTSSFADMAKAAMSSAKSHSEIQPRDTSDLTELGSVMHILCVDDDPLVRNVTCDMLRDLGHKVSETSNGNQGLSRLRQTGDAIDVLITDIRMPGLDGLRFAQIARGDRPNLPIIFFSAYAPVESPDEFYSIRLQKPCSLGALDAAITKMASRLTLG
jgi:CheY-like chemotaxis protein